LGKYLCTRTLGEEGFNGYDGFAWYRKKFDGKLLSKEDTYYLNLGFIDDCDEVFLNGKLIGFSGAMPPKFKTAYNNERKYTLLNELINFEGDNIIAIRVFDVTLGGGIIDGDLGVYRSPKSRMIADLQGMWLFKITWDDTALPKGNDGWEKILVPIPWEEQGFGKYDGNAWYKRSFTLTAQQLNQKEDLVLILGKIDDFDRTYLNGKLIGETNDKRPYGSSHSYSTQRVYDIPKGLLKASNVVEVFVQDMGNIGGFYEGPIGIVTRSVYRQYYDPEKKFFWENE